MAKAPGSVIPLDRRLRHCLTALCCIVACGCQSLGVEAWERDILSRPEMQFSERDMNLALDDHFYFSKEGTSGGRGFAGGGCGCN